VVAPLLSRKLGASFSGDEIAENRSSTLKLSRFILWVNPIGDFLCLHVSVPEIQEALQCTICRTMVKYDEVLNNLDVDVRLGVTSSFPLESSMKG
jgi:hypothetical protein